MDISKFGLEIDINRIGSLYAIKNLAEVNYSNDYVPCYDISCGKCIFKRDKCSFMYKQFKEKYRKEYNLDLYSAHSFDCLNFNSDFIEKMCDDILEYIEKNYILRSVGVIKVK